LFAPNGPWPAAIKPLAADWVPVADLARTANITFSYCLRPGSLANGGSNDAAYHTLKTISSFGFDSYSLCFDDVNGGDTQSQLHLQVKLVQNLTSSFPHIRLVSFTPGSYYGSARSQQTKLKYLDNALPTSISLVLTGPVVTPNSISTSTSFPKLNRRIIFWDNWNAEDTSVRLPWGLTRSVPHQLFSGTANFGYVMNLAFPPERIVHQIFRTGQLRHNYSLPMSSAITLAANRWSAWLTEFGYWKNASNTAPLTQGLKLGIEQDVAYSSVSQMEQHLPMLKGVFPQ